MISNENRTMVLAAIIVGVSQLLADATKNARITAQQFASDSGAQVGKIRSANQGTIKIFGSDGNDESAPYSPTSTPSKKIRVVSTFEFELR
jgi:hypothetical protein